MALTKDTPRTYVLGNINSLPVKASTTIYEGAAVGTDSASGYGRNLNAGDAFQGFAERSALNGSGSDGDIRVRVIQRGEIQLAVANAAITDINKNVYASDDGTFTLTAGSNSHVGRIVRWVSTGVVIVYFDAADGGLIAPLTDSTGGTADGTLSDVGAAFNQANINNNFAELAAKVNAIAAMLK